MRPCAANCDVMIDRWIMDEGDEHLIGFRGGEFGERDNEIGGCVGVLRYCTHRWFLRFPGGPGRPLWRQRAHDGDMYRQARRVGRRIGAGSLSLVSRQGRGRLRDKVVRDDGSISIRQ